MGAAISLFVLLSFSVFINRIASVALRLTGLPDSIARFQALSAFSGAGFTTAEAETVINYPVRRRIISLLIIIGNLGMVAVFSTLVVSFLNTDGEVTAVINQLLWLAAGLILLWFMVLNPVADRVLCTVLSILLAKLTILGRMRFHRLLQISNDLSIADTSHFSTPYNKIASLFHQWVKVRKLNPYVKFHCDMD
jgi:hypothetical protein